MFTLAGYGTMAPDAANAQGSECIDVIYKGTIDADVVLNQIDVTDSASGLAQYLTLKVFTEDFSGGCAGGILAGSIDPSTDTSLSIGTWAATGGSRRHQQ